VGREHVRILIRAVPTLIVAAGFAGAIPSVLGRDTDLIDRVPYAGVMLLGTWATYRIGDIVGRRLVP
jgi:hypothetical protein